MQYLTEDCAVAPIAQAASSSVESNTSAEETGEEVDDAKHCNQPDKSFNEEKDDDDDHPDVPHTWNEIDFLANPTFRAFTVPSHVYDTRKDMRKKCEDANRKGFVQFGEAASMLPVLVADIQKHHTCLDLCAAPGNKTLAISDFASEGAILANDYDIQRTVLTLTRHTGKAAHNGMMVSLYDGIGLWRRVGEEKFDRVVADVPCSADGTLRKHRDTINDFKKKFWFA